MAGVIALMLAGFGIVFLITGLGLVWAAWPVKERVPGRVAEAQVTPAAT
jgi:hypothetical protein